MNKPTGETQESETRPLDFLIAAAIDAVERVTTLERQLSDRDAELRAAQSRLATVEGALRTARNCIAMELEAWDGDTEGLYMAKVLPKLDAALADTTGKGT